MDFDTAPDARTSAERNDSNELEPRVRRPSDIPTVPAPRQTAETTRRMLLTAYRKESARLTRFAAELKEMGIDVSEAWGAGGAPNGQ